MKSALTKDCATPDKFKLQVNTSGAWRDVVSGTKEQLQEAEHHTAMLARIFGGRAKWRIIDAAFDRVIGYCNEKNNFGWTPPK